MPLHYTASSTMAFAKLVPSALAGCDHVVGAVEFRKNGLALGVCNDASEAVKLFVYEVLSAAFGSTLDRLGSFKNQHGWSLAFGRLRRC
jgi:hypothetical protein